MISKLKRLLKGEGGITGLETAIILIAFVVVAAVFAFTVLSAGVCSADKGKEAVYAGLAEVSGSMEVMGSVIAKATTEDTYVDYIVFSLANVAGGEPIDFTAHGSGNKVIIDYRDEFQRERDIKWTATALGKNDKDVLLEPGELFQITVDLAVVTAPTLKTNTSFVIELKPQTGGVIVIERTTPAYINKVMDLH